MEMSDIGTELEAGLEASGVPVYPGYPETDAVLPYVVYRPLLVAVPSEAFALCGGAVAWDFQFAVYCCGGSVEASFNLAKIVAGVLQGKHVEGSTLTTSMGYIGAFLEGRYESQVTAQVYQGEL